MENQKYSSDVLYFLDKYLVLTEYVIISDHLDINYKLHMPGLFTLSMTLIHVSVPAMWFFQG